MAKTIYFDMDGTIVDLYGQEDWLEKLRAEDISPYVNAKPLINMEELQKVVNQLKQKGYKIGVITWLSKDGTKDYNMKTSLTKIEWLKKHFALATDNHFVKYGTPKHEIAKGMYDILIDDNDEILKGWKENKKKGKAIDAKGNIIRELKALL